MRVLGYQGIRGSGDQSIRGSRDPRGAGRSREEQGGVGRGREGQGGTRTGIFQFVVWDGMVWTIHGEGPRFPVPRTGTRTRTRIHRILLINLI